MARDIQVIPPGLLGLLQIKNSGRNPNTLLESYQPVIEMFRWLMEARAIDWASAADYGNGQFAQVTLVTGNIGLRQFTTAGGRALTVPNDEAWWVEEYSVLASAAGADTSAYQPCWAIAGGVASLYTLTEQPMGAAVGGLQTRAARQFWLPPGAILGMMVGAVTAAVNQLYTAHLRFTPLPL